MMYVIFVTAYIGAPLCNTHDDVMFVTLYMRAPLHNTHYMQFYCKLYCLEPDKGRGLMMDLK